MGQRVLARHVQLRRGLVRSWGLPERMIVGGSPTYGWSLADSPARLHDARRNRCLSTFCLRQLCVAMSHHDIKRHQEADAPQHLSRKREEPTRVCHNVCRETSLDVQPKLVALQDVETMYCMRAPRLLRLSGRLAHLTERTRPNLEKCLMMSSRSSFMSIWRRRQRGTMCTM